MIQIERVFGKWTKNRLSVEMKLHGCREGDYSLSWNSCLCRDGKLEDSNLLKSGETDGSFQRAEERSENLYRTLIAPTTCALKTSAHSRQWLNVRWPVWRQLTFGLPETPDHFIGEIASANEAVLRRRATLLRAPCQRAPAAT